MPHAKRQQEEQVLLLAQPTFAVRFALACPNIMRFFGGVVNAWRFVTFYEFRQLMKRKVAVVTQSGKLRGVTGRYHEEEQEERFTPMRAVGAGFGVTLLLLFIATSEYYAVDYIEAEIQVQNFTEHETQVTSGMTLLTYETRSTDTLTTKADFDGGTYSADNFETGEDDMLAVSAADDFAGLNHYGDNPPDTTDNNWWDDDADSSTLYNWRYRRCFEVDNTSSGTDDLEEYQVYLSVDTATLVSAGKMQADGGDIRFTNEVGTEIPYFIADDMNSAGTRIWVQVDDISASDSEEICMYYGHHPGVVATTESREDVFTYSSDTEIYHVVQDSAENNVTHFASYIDDNDITVSGYSDTLDQYEFDTYPTAAATLTQPDAISTTHPISGIWADNGTDNLVPASFAGQAFAYRMDRGTNEFSIISPWCDADVEVRNENNTIVSGGTFTVTQGTFNNFTTNDTAGTGIANDSAVIIETTNGCDILVNHHDTGGGDNFPMHPASTEWYGVGSGSLEIAALQNATTVTVYRSTGTTQVYNLNRGDNVALNDPGSEGSENAHRVVANNPIGVNSLADSDGGEATTFLPADDLGYRYYFPHDIQYIAIATPEGVTTTVDLYNDATSCGVGAPDDTATVAAAATFPGKVYFGSTTDGTNIAEGACIVADNPVHAYAEYSLQNDEHNAWNETQNRQFVSPAPTYSVGTEEIGLWNISGSEEWIRRIPVTVSNTSTSALSEYQVRVDLGADVAAIFGKTQTDGGDIRVAGSLGDGTDDIVYSLENWDDAASEGSLWVKVPSIPASGNATFYIYYSPIGVDIAALSSLIWLDAADTSTITDVGGFASQWDDKSGSGNNVTQATAASRPSIITDGIHQVLSFNADWMVDSTGIFGAATHNDTYVFSVYKNLILPDTGALFYETVTGGRYGAWSPWGTTLYYQPGTAGYLTATYAGDTTDYHVLRYESHSSGLREMARDGGVLASDAAGVAFTGNNSSFQVAAYPGGTNPQDVNLGEMIVINAPLTGAQITDIENYLTEKWVTRPSTTLTTTGDHFAVFQTATVKPNYYVVDSLNVVQQLSIISFNDGNSVNDGGTTQIVDEEEIVAVPFGAGIVQEDVYEVRGPLHIDFNADASDAALPIGFAGTEFVYRIGRNSDVFSIKAPFADASVQIQQSSGAGWTTLTTVPVTAGTVATIAQDIVNNRAFRILSDEPVLAFARSDTFDSKALYPVAEALDPDSGMYELYGVPTASLQLASNGPANVTIYRSDNTSTAVVLNAGNDFAYTESGGGTQGDARGYRIVSDAPIGATSYADSDGGEAVVFWGYKEFSDEYILASPAQYMSVVAMDPNVTCRVYDETGTEVTTGPATMDNVPPQTTGGLTGNFPNFLHIGGNDTSDPAFFQAGYSMRCDEPVYAFYEHHFNTAITDETSWLNWNQGRTRNHVEPTVEDPDSADEEGLYYESGFDSAGAGVIAEASAEYIFDTSGFANGEHTYWRDISWEEVLIDRAGENAVAQLTIETASAAPSPTCALATYGAFSTLSDITTTGTSANALTYSLETTNDKIGQIVLDDSDDSCLKVRVTIRTGDEAFTPRLNEFTVGYYVPTELEGQLDSPVITVTGGTSGTDEEYRLMKAITTDAGFAGSEGFLTYYDVSTPAVFTQADFDIYEEPTSTQHAQFSFPPFPGVTPVSSVNHVPFDSSSSMLIYFTHERTAGAIETIDMSLDVDLLNADGPLTSRDFQVEVTGI